VINCFQIRTCDSRLWVMAGFVFMCLLTTTWIGPASGDEIESDSPAPVLVNFGNVITGRSYVN